MTDELAERIAVALERIAAAFEAGPPTKSADVCTHPIEYRDDYSTMGHPGRYRCDPRKGGCGHQNF